MASSELNRRVVLGREGRRTDDCAMVDGVSASVKLSSSWMRRGSRQRKGTQGGPRGFVSRARRVYPLEKMGLMEIV